MNWKQLVDERNEWVAHNFPDERLDEPWDESIIGLIEEVGELSHAHLKAAQKIRGEGTKHEQDARDAIGDATIYLLGILKVVGLPPDHVGISHASRNAISPTWCLKYLSYHTGQIALAPDMHLCCRVIEYLETYCDYQGWDYEEIVMSTWAEVKKRDWIKYPDTGLPDPGREPNEYVRVTGKAQAAHTRAQAGLNGTQITEKDSVHPYNLDSTI